jgi:hypothetical protein
MPTGASPIQRLLLWNLAGIRLIATTILRFATISIAGKIDAPS